MDHITRLALRQGVKGYVHVSSTSVYGLYPGKPFVEDQPRMPRDDYGRSKRDGEDVVRRRIREGLPALIARPCTVYGPRCTDGAGKAFSRPTSILAIPGSGRQLLSNVRAEDVALAVEHLSRLPDAVGEAFNIADDSHPAVGDSLRLAAEAFGTKPPRLHLPLALVRAFARVDGFLAARRGRIPDLESDAVGYLVRDYVVDNRKLKKTGFSFLYADFESSMREMGERFRKESAR